MNYDVIRKLLDTQLQTVVGLPTLYTENNSIEVDGRGAFCRSTLLNSEPMPLTVGPNGNNQYKGLYQVDLFYPQDNGTTTQNALAGLVIDAFPRSLILNDATTGLNVHVDMSWQLTAYTVQQNYYVVPISVRWSSYA